mgnify:CR=1 FL=1
MADDSHSLFSLSIYQSLSVYVYVCASPELSRSFPACMRIAECGIRRYGHESVCTGFWFRGTFSNRSRHVRMQRPVSASGVRGGVACMHPLHPLPPDQTQGAVEFPCMQEDRPSLFFSAQKKQGRKYRG